MFWNLMYLYICVKIFLEMNTFSQPIPILYIDYLFITDKYMDLNYQEILYFDDVLFISTQFLIWLFIVVTVSGGQVEVLHLNFSVKILRVPSDR